MQVTLSNSQLQVYSVCIPFVDAYIKIENLGAVLKGMNSV